MNIAYHELMNGGTLEAWVRPTAVTDWRSVVMKENASGGIPYTLYAGSATLGEDRIEEADNVNDDFIDSYIELKMAEAYTPRPPKGAADEYRCQVLDPGLTKEAFLTGTHVMPDNVAIAHHGIVYAVPPGDAAAVRKHDANTPGLGWQCFGGTGVDGAVVEEGDAAWVDTWARLVTTKGRTEASRRRMPYG